METMKEIDICQQLQKKFKSYKYIHIEIFENGMLADKRFQMTPNKSLFFNILEAMQCIHTSETGFRAFLSKVKNYDEDCDDIEISRTVESMFRAMFDGLESIEI